MVSNEEKKEALGIVYELRNLDVLREVITMMKISDPIGINEIRRMVK